MPRRPLISRPWSAEDDAKLIKLTQDGKNALAAAVALGRTKSAVITRKAKLGVTANRLTRNPLRTPENLLP